MYWCNWCGKGIRIDSVTESVIKEGVILCSKKHVREISKASKDDWWYKFLESTVVPKEYMIMLELAE